MVAVPTDTPNAAPPLTKTTEVLLLLHVPPLVASLSSVPVRKQIFVGPVIAAGVGLTVIMIATEQPVEDSVYVTVAVPAEVAVTVVTVATGLRIREEDVLHVPPAVPSLSVMLADWHIDVAPEITAGNGLTVTTAVVVQPVPNL